MLILTDTDGFRIDLNQLCQRILQPSCYRCRTPLSHVKLRELLRCQFTCGIYRCSCFIYNHILHFFRNLLQKLYNKLFRFSGCGSISQGNQGNIIFRNNFLQQILRCLNLLRCRRGCRINNRRSDYLSGRIDHCKLTSGTECRVPSKNRLSHNRRLHQKLFQIFSEYGNRSILRLFGKIVTDFPLNCRCNQTLIAVLHRFLKRRCRIRIIRMNRLLLQITDNILLRCLDLDRQEFLLLSTVQCQCSVPCKLCHRLLKIIIHLIDRFCLFILSSRDYLTLFHRRISNPASVIRLI